MKIWVYVIIICLSWLLIVNYVLVPIAEKIIMEQLDNYIEQEIYRQASERMRDEIIKQINKQLEEKVK